MTIKRLASTRQITNVEGADITQVCELCGKYSPWLNHAFSNEKLKTVFYCAVCMKAQGEQMGLAFEHAPHRDSIQIGLVHQVAKVDDITMVHILDRLLVLSEIFEQIEGIYVIPSSNFKNSSRFKDRLNVAIKVKPAVYWLPYARYAKLSGGTVNDIWGSENREMLWPTVISKLMLTLGFIHSVSRTTSMWIWLGSRIISIEFFTKDSSKLICVSPSRVIKIKLKETTK